MIDMKSLSTGDLKTDISGLEISQRVASIDVYRGFVMLLMMGEILSFSKVSEALPDSSFWCFLAFNQTHVEWIGLSLHDMIQPSFTFLVGVVLPFSIAVRRQRGASQSSILLHSIRRSLILIFLGIFLRSIYSSQTNFTFEDTLTQIGLGYSLLVVLGFCSQKIQLVAFVVLLVGYWGLFALYPLPAASFDYAAAGVTTEWPHNLNGFAAHWNKNTNLAWAFDKWFLNLFPRENVFLHNGGGYATLSFIPTLCTMLLGLMAGNKLHSNRTNREKWMFFLVTGICLIVIGLVIHFTGVNPIVKRIWTPAWTIFSGGICFLMLTFFYLVVDVKGYKRWSFFLRVIGANSIAAYCIADGGIMSFIRKSLYIHLGQTYDRFFGAPYASLLSGGLTLLVVWLILNWMYREKIFIKI